MELTHSAIKKVVIIGPESTGKSTLCRQLAKKYNTLWCPEYARQYLLQHGMDYSFADLLTIAKGQLALEDDYTDKLNKNDQAQPLLFIDTDMYVMKVWCEYVFNDCHPFILEQIVQRRYDLYLLCKPDLPWVADELREYPDEKPRQELYHIYRELMTEQRVPWVEIHGDAENRLQLAVQAVNKYVLLKESA